MRYGLKFSTIASDKLLRVPEFAADQIVAGLDALAEDPDKHGRRAVCPPYPPFGYQCDIACREGGALKYHCVAFFVYSDCGKFLEIHRMVIHSLGAVPDPALKRDMSQNS